MTEMQLAGVEAVGLDGAVGVCGEVAVFQVAEGDGLIVRKRLRRAIDAVTGVTLVAFGARLASEPL